MQKKFTLIFLLCFVVGLSYGQQKIMSKHTLSYYKNDREEKFIKGELSILVDNMKIPAKLDGAFYTFPLIDTAKEFNIIVHINQNEFKSGSYKAIWLNNGSRMIFGRLVKIEQLISVAQYNGMNKEDTLWEQWSKRFFIIERAYTIDIENHEKVKELHFLIFNPNQDGDGIYNLTQKTIKLKN